MTDTWTEVLDGRVNRYGMLGFSKAFDKVPYKHLDRNVKAYGVGGDVLERKKNFLSAHRQSIMVAGTESAWAKITSGIQKGSVTNLSYSYVI